MTLKPRGVLVLLMLGYALQAHPTYDIPAVFLRHALATRFLPPSFAV